MPTSPNLDMGSGNFTIECWLYMTGNQISKYIAGVGTVNGTTRSVSVWVGGTQQLEGYFSTDGSTWASYSLGATTVPINSWAHIAFVKSGTTLYLFLNGVSDGTQTNTASGSAFSGKIGYVGGQGNYYLNGYIDDLRITKGYARYTSNFTAPASALITK
jgi:hypothetical protein